MRSLFVTFCLYLCLSQDSSTAGRVLIVTPFPLYSHQVPYQNLWKALAVRGHEVVLINTIPIGNFTRPNFRQISVRECIFPPNIKFTERISWMSLCQSKIHGASNDIADIVLRNKEVRTLLRDPEQRFDVVIVEHLYTPAFFALGHKFGAPTIGIVSLGVPVLGEYSIGDIVLPSYPTTWEVSQDTGFNLSFWTRINNFLRLWLYVRASLNGFMAMQHSIAEKHLGPGIPSLFDLQKNVSVIFTNEDPAISFVRPRTAKVVQYTGFHFPNDPDPLPKDIEEFLGNGTEGFVYFSLGTIVRSSHLPSESRAIFHEVFSNLPCKVLWKYEAELPGRPPNVYTAKRFPQYSVLADPRIKLFIYHGGLQSTQEAIHYTVPVIGMPVFVDQHKQIDRLVSLGVARRLDIFHLTKESLQEQIHEMLHNDSYRRRMKELKALVNDKPQESLEKLVWWTEHVMRWKGAPHLSTPIADEPWHRRYDADIVGFLAIAAFVLAVCGLAALCKVLVIASRFHAKALLSKGKKKAL